MINTTEVRPGIHPDHPGSISRHYFDKKVLFGIISLLFSTFLSTAQNSVTTYAGTGSSGFINGDTSIASFNKPFGMCIDQGGNLFIADMGNNCIRKIGIDGIVSTYAGTGVAGYQDGEASQAQFRQPANLCIDSQGNLYVSDFQNQRIRKISPDLMVSTIAGNGQAGYHDSTAMEAKFNYPRGICLDDEGNIYIGDSWNHRVRKISTDGLVTTYAGGGTSIGVQSVGAYLDGTDTSARFYTPCELAIDEMNNIFVADAYNHRIRKIDPDRLVTTLAGSGGSGPDSGSFADGPALEARFNTPTAVTVTDDGILYVGDGPNQRVRMIGNDLMVTTFAGTGEAGFANGPDSLASFNFPRASVMDYNLDRLYVVDYNNHAVRIIHLSGTTGLEEDKYPVGSLRVFPNPVINNTLWIENPGREELSIQVSNIAGQMLLTLAGRHENYIPVDLSTLPAGIYVLVISEQGRIIKAEKIFVLGGTLQGL
jgi:hypothetical protein